jgi:hypothetical protein
MLVNPYLIKRMPGRKSDVKDAQWIAILLHKGLLRGSLVPSKEIRELRSYSRRYMKLQHRQTSVLQDMDRILVMCSIRITSFIGNISAKSVLHVVEQIVHGITELRPRNDESAGKYKSTAMTKGNKYLKSISVQIAWAASRTKGSYFREKFSRLSIRKPLRKALIAKARKIAVLMWNMLHYEQYYNPARLIIYEPGKVDAKVKYHQREIERLEKLL